MLAGQPPDVWAGHRRRRRLDLIRMVALRSALIIPIVLLVSLGVFALAAVSPFDPLVAYLGDRFQRVGAADRLELAQALGLDTPWWTAWTTWLGGLVSGDFGHSRVFGQSVAQVVAERLPWTLLLSGGALLVASAGGLGLGLLSGLRPGAVVDRVVEGGALTIQAVPPYVLSLATILVFALGLGWFPAGGARPVGTLGPHVSPGALLHHATLPMLVLGISQTPWLLLAVRSATRSALASDPVRAAVTRGLPWPTVVRGHVLPQALVPLLALLGVRLPELVVGAVLVEEIFAWPGIAAAIVAAARALDLPLLAFLTVASTVLVLTGSLLADLAHAALDPGLSIDG